MLIRDLRIPVQLQVQVRQITLPETYPARRAVLYPTGPESKIHIPNDEEGIHFGAFLAPPPPAEANLVMVDTRDSGQTDLVAVISLFCAPLPLHLVPFAPAAHPSKSLRFRKFATLEQHQSRGIGTKVFQHVLDLARTDPELGLGTTVWCNARWSTREWYLRRGMTVLGERFFKGDIEYIVMAIQA